MSIATEVPSEQLTPSKRSTNGRNGNRRNADDNIVTGRSYIAVVPIAGLLVSPRAQRDLRNSKVNKIASNFNPDRLGTITVSRREDNLYIVDGQHRVEALRCIGAGEKNLEARIYEGLTERDEADLFLWLNDQLSVAALDKFKVAVTAGDPEAVAITKLLSSLGLRITRGGAPGTITAVGKVKTIHAKYGPETLSRTLAIITMAFGDAGLSADVISGISLVIARYGDALNDDHAIEKLRKMNAGVVGLTNRARVQQKQLGKPFSQCVAAKVVDQVNTGRGGRKLPEWWRD